MMFTLLTGRHVHEGETANAQLVAAATQQAPPLLSVMPELSPAIANLVDVALAFDPEARWPDAQAMQDALRRAYRYLEGSPVEDAPRLDVPARPASVPEGLMRAATATTGSGSVAERSIARRTGRPLLGVAVAASGICVVVGGLLALRARAPAGAAIPPSPAAATASVAPAAAEPAVSTTSRGPVEPLPEVGTLRIAVQGGTCAIKVDDATFDAPPPGPIQVAVGDHDVVCTPARGSPLHQTARVRVGELALVTFTIAAPPAQPRGPVAPPLDAKDRRR